MKRSTMMQFLLKFNHKFSVRATEWLCASVLFLWGVVLLSSPTAFDQGSNYYWTLERLFSQTTWAWACGGMGFVRLLALYVNGSRRETPFARMATAFLSCFFWYQIALGLALSGVINTGLAVYPVLLVFEVYNVLRSSIDARLVYDEYTRVAVNGTNEQH